MTDALAAFLRSQFGDDAQTALAAGDGWYGYDPEQQIAFVPPEDSRHIARQNPARTLRDVEAKWQLLDAALADRHHISADQYETCPRATASDGLDANTAAALEALNEERRQEDGVEPKCWDSCGRDARVRRTLELLALPYSDHPEYGEALTGG